MKAFHFDFNTALFRPETIRQWLYTLADLGFDTILWEVENAFAWQSCPECAVPDTLPINELKALLALAKSLGFENIPLLQTLGHSEYVLKHERYAHLREDGCMDQYCPLHPDLLPFLGQWIDEYMAVFDSPRYLHVGADETILLGACPQCKACAAEKGLAGLYRGHMDPVIDMVVSRGARPLLWADMFLSHPESLEGLSRDIILCDWAYERDNESSDVFLFEHGKFSAEAAPESAIQAFGRHLFKEGCEPLALNPWVAADYLHAKGFNLILCPATSHSGDAVYVPRMGLHLRNIGDTVAYASKLQTRGTILTSWTWHLFPLELQQAMMAYYIEAAKGVGMDQHSFLNGYGETKLTLPTGVFSEICGLLEVPCPLSDAKQLGFFKGCLYRSVKKLEGFMLAWQAEGVIAEMVEQTVISETAHRKASEMLAMALDLDLPELKAWQLAAAGLIVRAQSARCLLSRYLDVPKFLDAQDLIQQETLMREQFLNATLKDVLPFRAEEMISCQFDTVIEALGR